MHLPRQVDLMFRVSHRRRKLALLVLLISAFQIAACAAGCDCFQPIASAAMSSHSFSQGDADGCLCCAHSARVPVVLDVPGLLPEQFVPSKSALHIPQFGTLRIDRPPRS
jgi:hypothetical protein